MSQTTTCFSNLRLADFLLRALGDMGFETPTPVQEYAIPLLLKGCDVIGQAQTGTGKTAAFALPLLQKIVLDEYAPQALILSPTRELAIQIAEQMTALGRYHPANIVVLCGGQDYRPQLKQLKAGAQIVVGTPGRVLDHMSRGSLQLNQLRTFVLDEADEMLRMGFIEDVETILEALPAQRQMALFSATMPPRIRQIAENYLNNPQSVTIKSETATAPAIHQKFLFASLQQKPSALLRLLAVETWVRVIVFVRTKVASEEIASLLISHGYRAIALHGDLQQKSREKILEQFRSGQVEILVATDVAARGLDVDNVSHVFNYDIPQSSETYVHRIGRTGRAGKTGVSILFVSPKEGFLLNRIERHTRQRIEKVQPPTDEAIQQARSQRFSQDIIKRLENPKLAEYQKLMRHFMQNHQEVATLDVAAALALMLHHDKTWHHTLPKIESIETRTKEKRTDRRDRSSDRYERSDRHERFDRHERSDKPSSKKSFRSNEAMACYRVDVGKTHGARPGNLVGAIANEGGLSSRQINGIEIHQDFSTVLLPRDIPKKVVQGISKAWVCGRQLNLSEMRA